MNSGVQRLTKKKFLKLQSNHEKSAAHIEISLSKQKFKKFNFVNGSLELEDKMKNRNVTV